MANGKIEFLVLLSALTHKGRAKIPNLTALKRDASSVRLPEKKLGISSYN